MTSISIVEDNDNLREALREWIDASPGYRCLCTCATMREALEELCRHARTGSAVKSVPKAPFVALMRLSSVLGLSPLGPYHVMYGEELFFDIGKAVILFWQGLKGFAKHFKFFAVN